MDFDSMPAGPEINKLIHAMLGGGTNLPPYSTSGAEALAALQQASADHVWDVMITLKPLGGGEVAVNGFTATIESFALAACRAMLKAAAAES
jgi:hypothetical protein